MIKRGELIIWRENSPDVEKGVFGYVSDYWGNDVKCFYINQPVDERFKVGWEVDSYANVDVKKIPHTSTPDEFITHVITLYPNAIHIFSGFRGKLQKYVDAYIKLSNGKKFMCLVERPVKEKNYFKNLLKNVLLWFLAYKYNRHISAFLAMGRVGVEIFQRIGFNKDLLYPFMYNPEIKFTNQDKTHLRVNYPMKFLYLGRFDYRFKGCDLMMQTFNTIDSSLKDKWSLTIVGGYGPQVKEMIEWTKKNSNIIYNGSWSQNDIIVNMSGFDVCIVPSRQDGWNLSPNYSIFSHVGMIVSDEAVSNELIDGSNSGIVYHYNDLLSFKKHIEYAINNKEIVFQWKQNTYNFMDKITSKTVGDYFIDIVDYTYYCSLKKPSCPWLKIHEE